MIIDVVEAIKGLSVDSAWSGEGLTPWWHGLDRGAGKGALESALGAGFLTAMDAREPAGLTWEPELERMYTIQGAIDNFRAIIRNDTRNVLGVVSDRYQVVSNEGMATVADSAFNGEARCTVAGSLGGGRTVFYCMKLHSFQVKGDDSPTDLYMVITSAHDGTGAAKVLVSPVRVVCQNTLRAARQSAAWESTIRHTGDTDAKMGDAMLALKRAEKFGAHFNALGDIMADTRYDAAEYGSTLATVMTATKKELDWLKAQQDDTTKSAGSWVPSPNAPLLDQLITAAPFVPEDLISKRVRDERDIMERMLTAGEGVEGTGLEGTAWGAFQGVTEYYDHHKTANLRETRNGDAASRRAQSILTGDAARAKGDALDIILAQTNLAAQADAIMA